MLHNFKTPMTQSFSCIKTPSITAGFFAKGIPEKTDAFLDNLNNMCWCVKDAKVLIDHSVCYNTPIKELI